MRARFTLTMSASTDLKDLIDNLSRSEKRHFKLWTGTKLGAGDNLYLKLFDLLDRGNGKGRSANVTDAVILKRLGLDSKSRFARLRNYLYNTLLISLEDYHREATVDMRFVHLVNQAEILKHKRLHKQAKKVMQKAKKLATEKGIGIYELWFERLELDRMVRAESFKEVRQHLENYESRKNYHLQKAADYLDLQMIKGKLIWLLRYGDSDGNPVRNEWLTELADHEMLTTIKYPEDVEFLLYYYNLNGLVAGAMGNLDEAYGYSRAYLKTYRENPDYIRRWPENYIIALGNVAGSAAAREDWDQLLDCTTEMRTFLEREGIRNRASLDAMARIRSNGYEASAFRGLDWSKREEINAALEADYAKQRLRMPKVWRMIVAYSIGHHHFAAGNYDEALTWIGPLVLDADDRLYPELQGGARMLNILLHYELGNDRFLQGAIPAMRTWMRKVKLPIACPGKLLDEIRRHLRAVPESDRDMAWQEIAPSMIETLCEGESRWLWQRIDLESWLARKGVLENALRRKVSR